MNDLRLKKPEVQRILEEQKRRKDGIETYQLLFAEDWLTMYREIYERSKNEGARKTRAKKSI